MPYRITLRLSGVRSAMLLMAMPSHPAARYPLALLVTGHRRKDFSGYTLPYGKGQRRKKKTQPFSVSQSVTYVKKEHTRLGRTMRLPRPGCFVLFLLSVTSSKFRNVAFRLS